MEPNARDLRDAVQQLIVAHGALSEVERPCGTKVSTSHAWALLTLRETGAMTVGELASRLNIDRTNVSRLCRRLADAGEVQRVPHPEDGRAQLLTLSALGRERADQVDRASARHFERVLARVGAARATLDALDALTDAMREAR